jgi:hypothetical protein
MIAFFIEPPVAPAPCLDQVMPLMPISTKSSKLPPPGAGSLRQNGDRYWTEIIIETLKIEDGPMAITALVNAAAKWGDYNCRTDREQRKLQLFKLIGHLIRTGVLDRYCRNFVVIPATSEKRRAYLAQAAGPVDLPEPCV